MSRKRFEATVAAAAASLGATRTKAVATLLSQGRSPAYVLGRLQTPAALESVSALLAAITADGVPLPEAAAYLRGYAVAWARRGETAEARTVWSGPATPGTPVRATARVLTEVVRAAEHRFVAMTYSARAYPPLTASLADATARGVTVDIVVETLEGAAGLLAGREPSEAFSGVPGLRLWHWPSAMRPAPGSRMHAKVAVADDRVLFLSSANLTAAGAERNVEAGILLKGGPMPGRMADHIRELQRRGVLVRWPGPAEGPKP
ncbi:DISARM system phospholipase D-like protein DrmC [Streptomyces aidingensis]|uniref:PLD-like domain-containing protein n=1 Tax=Streptomyces aidingensis TaxID=910347 RepID=A0A1I1URP9_9ACTN|nr:DISARM system phospholipase D-like protein DrmC [Streptomyces aidingensis]SFD73265.1 PLD-like domain-containing protein [Streptomyces aidingensis]